MSFDVGALVHARGREWIVLPDSRDDLLVLRPLGGTDDEIAGIAPALESVSTHTFPLPDPARDLGDHRACALLRDAVRIGFRAGAGPFRSFARIGVEPRPYQLVPLLMALRLDPVRLLIADDVGVGKTVEALLIAAELVARGEIDRFTVLCPPQLAEGWRRAMTEQFRLPGVEKVLPATAHRLEEGRAGSLFDHHPFTVVSMDYIKSEARRERFKAVCPELVIVDEAHGCADLQGARGAQLRYGLLRELAADPRRHMLLVTATPHGGDEHAFRSLLHLLSPTLRDLPSDLSGNANRRHREQVARFFVQRRREDLVADLGGSNPFPVREVADAWYALTPLWRDLFKDVLSWCRARVLDGDGHRRQRVRWWAALALLRALSSSPRAAAQTIARVEVDLDEDDADTRGRALVHDADEDASSGDSSDDVPADDDAVDRDEAEQRAKLAARMRALEGAKDPKLQRALSLVAGMVADGFNPVIFCRFIPTVGYLADALRKKLGAGVTVTAITGLQPPDEREAAIQTSASAPRRVLVCTDCLSEGINLQPLHDAVMHYDLCWNPTRHEQREGRVDRYNQPSPAVRALTFYGADNPIDGLVLDVILRRTRQIQKQLGVLLDVPDADDAAVMEALLEASLFRQRAADDQLALPFARSVPADGAPRWQRDDARRRKSFAIYAQHGLDFDDVKPELDATREALGDREATERLVRAAVPALRGLVRDLPDGGVELLPGALPLVLRDAFDDRDALLARFSGATRGAEVLLTRTHPLVDALAAHVVETALDPKLPSVAKRCGVIRTRTVAAQTVVLVLRHRFHIVTADAARGGATRDLLAEELSAAGFTGNPDAPNWVDDPAALDALLGATPDANLPEALALPRLQRVVGGLDQLRPALDARARLRAAALLAAHQRVRSVTGGGPKTRDVVPLSTDVLAVSIFIPTS